MGVFVFALRSVLLNATILYFPAKDNSNESLFSYHEKYNIPLNYPLNDKIIHVRRHILTHY